MLDFHDELFEYRNQAMEALAEHDIVWFTDYSSIELDHREFGIRVNGLKSEEEAHNVGIILRRIFPELSFTYVFYQDFGREIGWIVSVSKLAKNSQDPLLESLGISLYDNRDPILEAAQVVDTRAFEYAQAIKDFVINGDLEPLFLLIKQEDSDAVIKDLSSAVALLKSRQGQELLELNRNIIETMPKILIADGGISRFVIYAKPEGEISISCYLHAKDMHPVYSASVYAKSSSGKKLKDKVVSVCNYLENWLMLNLLYLLNGVVSSSSPLKPEFTLLSGGAPQRVLLYIVAIINADQIKSAVLQDLNNVYGV